MSAPIAFVGTRDFYLLEEEYPALGKLYRQAAAWVGRSGRVLHTGGAPGADQCAAYTALEAGGTVRVFLPYTRFQEGWQRFRRGYRPGEPLHYTVYDPRAHPQWTESVDLYHPRPTSLSRVDRLFHARNYGLVQGCGALVALPLHPEPEKWGGSGQAMRIALATGIPLYNLWDAEARRKLARSVSRAA